MSICLRLTDYQLALIERQRAVLGAVTMRELATAAVEHECAREPDLRWRRPRPSRRRPSPIRTDVRLDAVLPAASGASLALAAGQRLRLEQIVDGQCVDLCIYEAGGLARAFSAARTRAIHGIHPSVGCSLWSTPPEVGLLSIVADSAPGHDLCFPPCSESEYERHAGIAGHLSCAEVQAETRGSLGIAESAHSGVLNLWLPSAVESDGTLRSWPVACRRGDFIDLEARTDVVVTLSTCPDDLFGSSQYEPGPVRVIVHGGPTGPPARLPWPTRPPARALARHELAVSLGGTALAKVGRIAADGWLGDGPAEVVRALIFRHYESTLSC